jgi:hypothetical protein
MSFDVKQSETKLALTVHQAYEIEYRDIAILLMTSNSLARCHRGVHFGSEGPMCGNG